PVTGGLGELRVTGGVKTPLEYIPLDDQRARDLSLGRALRGRADVTEVTSSPGPARGLPRPVHSADPGHRRMNSNAGA
ncbi:hypothetical protein, partial [Frankia sp. Cppng1_Ct_nod]|uniref:hypothetical protein n=1 Tax=Frankia sp. Cppng1_Ct_nod TaxID=2897162 RepID=UPI0032EA609A